MNSGTRSGDAARLKDGGVEPGIGGGENELYLILPVPTVAASRRGDRNDVGGRRRSIAVVARDGLGADAGEGVPVKAVGSALGPRSRRRDSHTPLGAITSIGVGRRSPP